MTGQSRTRRANKAQRGHLTKRNVEEGKVIFKRSIQLKRAMKEMIHTNVVSLCGSRVDSDENAALEAEGKSGGTVRELDRIVLVTLERVYQKVLRLHHSRI